jgi:diguanylate cyclase (GGDEF)-like protein/PAS domain S-box-containing protein
MFWLATAAMLFGAVFAVRMVVPESGAAITFLYVLPIAIVAYQLGPAGGMAAGVLSVALFGAWAALTGTGVDTVAFVSRATPFLVVGALVGRLATERRALARSEARYRTVLENLPEMAITTFGRDLRVDYTAGEALTNTGRSAEEFVGRTLSEVLPPEHAELLETNFRAALRGERRSLDYRSSVGDREMWIKVVPLPGNGDGVQGGVAVSQDITERKRQEAALRESEERFKSAFEHAPIGMALVQPTMEGPGRIIRANQALSRMSGYSGEDLLTMNFAAITHPDDQVAEAPLMARLLAGEIATYDIEKRCLNAHGNVFWASFHASAVKDLSGGVNHLIVQLEDVTERKGFEGQLQYLADHDALTGLFNRRRFEEELSRQTALGVRYKQGGAVLVLDLDNFKYLNDTLSHKAGDEAIGQTARLLTKRLRESDVVGRMGGDEFAILLPAADEAQARKVAEDLTAAISEQAFKFNGQRLGLTASVGIATFPGEVELSGEEVLVDADLAMYEAMERGRNRCAVFTADRQARMEARLTWSERIRQALEEDRFVLFAQPILNLELQRVTRYELLLRMVGDDGGLIPPASFLSIAERFGLIRDIDRWVVRNAIKLIDEQQREGRALSLEVNLSGKSVSDSTLPEMIAGELKARRVDPGSLIFEVTETAAIVNITEAQAFAATLTELGCRFALDDFGAGFGSFYYLKHLPFDYLKIDGEFIRNLSTTRSDQLVVKAVVEIAQGLGKRTIAEFVTDAETARLVGDLGVDYAQGYHIGRPRRLADALT